MHSEDYCNQYFEQFISLSPTYIWGMNIGQITSKKDTDDLFLKHGATTGKYTQSYYDKKYKEAMAGSRWASDCSGFLFQINSCKDLTAQKYFQNCVAVGPISTIDRTHSCLVFRGSETSIHHVGYYDAAIGEVLHMANSDKNFQHGALKTNEWSFWGKPSFIDYSSSAPSAKPYLKKGIDISSYQKNANYKALKEAGVEFAILKVINKQLQKDAMFEAHILGCTNAGISVPCVYNYSYATNRDQAIEAANAVLRALGNRMVAVCLDVEDSTQTRLGSVLADVINAYQNVIEASGRNFYLYTGLSFFNSYIKPYQANLHCLDRVWMARYNKGYTEMPFTEDPNQAFKPMQGIVAWQYTSSGLVNGINGKVDLDILYKDIVPTVSPMPSPAPQIRPTIRNTVNTGGANLNVRNKPDTSGEVVGKLKNGTNIIVYGVDKDTGWLRLSVTENKWCSSNYVSVSCQGQVVVENSVYIRSADSKAGEIWGFYKNGEKVKILHQSTNTGWYLTIGITDPSKRGWVSNKYVTLGG